MTSETLNRTAGETGGVEYRGSDYRPAKWVDFRRGYEKRFYVRYILTAAGCLMAQPLEFSRRQNPSPSSGSGFDLAKTESQLRAYLQLEGDDLDQLLDRAAVHFSSSSLAPRVRPLSADEIASLAADDDNALNA